MNQISSFCGVFHLFNLIFNRVLFHYKEGRSLVKLLPTFSRWVITLWINSLNKIIFQNTSTALYHGSDVWVVTFIFKLIMDHFLLWLQKLNTKILCRYDTWGIFDYRMIVLLNNLNLTPHLRLWFTIHVSNCAKYSWTWVPWVFEWDLIGDPRL